HYRLLAPPPVPAPGDLCEKLRHELRKRGASFFADLQTASGAFPADLLKALWDLVWSGEVTNDTLAPLRSYMRGEPRDDRRDRRFGVPFRSRRVAPPGSEGRWSLLPEPRGTPTERAAALARRRGGRRRPRAAIRGRASRTPRRRARRMAGPRRAQSAHVPAGGGTRP